MHFSNPYPNALRWDAVDRLQRRALQLEKSVLRKSCIRHLHKKLLSKSIEKHSRYVNYTESVFFLGQRF